MSVNGEPLVYLFPRASRPGTAACFRWRIAICPRSTARDAIQRDTLLIRRVLTLYRDTVFEHLEFTNYDIVDHQLEICLHFGTVFDDIFEVRGMIRRGRGRMLTPNCSGGKLTFSYQGLDEVLRMTTVEAIGGTPAIEVIDQSAATLTSRVTVPGKGRSDVKAIISFQCAVGRAALRREVSADHRLRASQARRRQQGARLSGCAQAPL